MGIDAALGQLLEYGVLGIAVIILVIVLMRKDKQVQTLYVRLIEKAERDANKYHELAEAMNDTLKELADVVLHHDEKER